MLKLIFCLLTIAALSPAQELLTKKSLSLGVIKAMVAGAEAEALKRNVHMQLTICIVDESGTLLYIQKADNAGLNTLNYCQKKARHSAFFRSPSKNAADQLEAGKLSAMIAPNAFPNQGGLPIKVDGQTIGGIAASGAASAIDEAVAQAGIDAFFNKK